MTFSQFKSLAAVARAFSIETWNEDFLRIHANNLPSASFLDRLPIILKQSLHKSSEAARCEMLIAPMLFDAWQQHASTLKLWSHAPLEVDAALMGTPDYVIAQQSKFGVAVMGTPIMVAVEAKQDNFIAGWGQCAAEMLAAQKLNEDESVTVFGIVTNGESWEFAKLEDKRLTQQPTALGIDNLSTLFGALSYIMEECAKQVTKEVQPAQAA
jgi:hypothetical protein